MQYKNQCFYTIKAIPWKIKFRDLQCANTGGLELLNIAGWRYYVIMVQYLNKYLNNLVCVQWDIFISAVCCGA